MGEATTFQFFKNSQAVCRPLQLFQSLLNLFCAGSNIEGIMPADELCAANLSSHQQADDYPPCYF